MSKMAFAPIACTCGVRIGKDTQNYYSLTDSSKSNKALIRSKIEDARKEMLKNGDNRKYPWFSSLLNRLLKSESENNAHSWTWTVKSIYPDKTLVDYVETYGGVVETRNRAGPESQVSLDELESQLLHMKSSTSKKTVKWEEPSTLPKWVTDVDKEIETYVRAQLNNDQLKRGIAMDLLGVTKTCCRARMMTSLSEPTEVEGEYAAPISTKYLDEVMAGWFVLPKAANTSYYQMITRPQATDPDGFLIDDVGKALPAGSKKKPRVYAARISEKEFQLLDTALQVNRANDGDDIQYEEEEE
jgi:DNA-directed RNA polymerase subunit N (RpoN/RPB10)